MQRTRKTKDKLLPIEAKLLFPDRNGKTYTAAATLPNGNVAFVGSQTVDVYKVRNAATPVHSVIWAIPPVPTPMSDAKALHDGRTIVIAYDSEIVVIDILASIVVPRHVLPVSAVAGTHNGTTPVVIKAEPVVATPPPGAPVCLVQPWRSACNLPDGGRLAGHGVSPDGAHCLLLAQPDGSELLMRPMPLPLADVDFGCVAPIEGTLVLVAHRLCFRLFVIDIASGRFLRELVVSDFVSQELHITSINITPPPGRKVLLTTQCGRTFSTCIGPALGKVNTPLPPTTHVADMDGSMPLTPASWSAPSGTDSSSSPAQVDKKNSSDAVPTSGSSNSGTSANGGGSSGYQSSASGGSCRNLGTPAGHGLQTRPSTSGTSSEDSPTSEAEIPPLAPTSSAKPPRRASFVAST